MSPTSSSSFSNFGFKLCNFISLWDNAFNFGKSGVSGALKGCKFITKFLHLLCEVASKGFQLFKNGVTHGWLFLRYLFFFCFPHNLSRPKSSTRDKACVITSKAYFESINSCSAQSSTRRDLTPADLFFFTVSLCCNKFRWHLPKWERLFQNFVRVFAFFSLWTTCGCNTLYRLTKWIA